MYRKLFSMLAFTALVLNTSPVFSQITLEKEYPYSTTITNSVKDNFYYYLMDGDLNECRIYNARHELFKTIPLEVPDGYYLFDIRYVTDQLFDPDHLLELLYLTYQYVSNEDGTGYYNYELRIINEEGSVLLQVPGAGYAEIISPDSVTQKLLCYVYDYSAYPYLVHTQVYNLGTTEENEEKDIQSLTLLDNPSPNPARDFIRVNYNTGEKAERTYLKLTDISGHILDSQNLQAGKGSIRLPVSMLPPGIYFLNLLRDDSAVVTKKIIIE